MRDMTCGNCYHCVPRHGTRFTKRDGVCLYCGEAVDTQSTSPICPCGNHRMWRERKGTIEQRYQQLEQVAKDLLEYFDRIGCVHMSIELRKKLTELGVELDG